MSPKTSIAKSEKVKRYHTDIIKDVYIDRIVHYYDLNLTFRPDYVPVGGDKVYELFKAIAQLANNKAPDRYQTYGEKAIFIQEVDLDSNSKLIKGKLRCVRKNILPELLDMDTDELRELDAKENEGLLETTHFIVSLHNITPLIAIEFHQFGGRINDFINYIRRIGIDYNILTDAKQTSIVKDELALIQQRIARCSEFLMRVHRDNVPQIEEMDEMLYSALKSTVSHFHSQYASVSLKFDYKNEDTTVIDNAVQYFLNLFKDNPEKSGYLKELKVRAEDVSKGFSLSNFDLLEGKIRSEIRVPRKEKYRIVLSQIMFDLMRSELIQKRLL